MTARERHDTARTQIRTPALLSSRMPCPHPNQAATPLEPLEPSPLATYPRALAAGHASLGYGCRGIPRVHAPRALAHGAIKPAAAALLPPFPARRRSISSRSLLLIRDAGAPQQPNTAAAVRCASTLPRRLAPFSASSPSPTPAAPRVSSSPPPRRAAPSGRPRLCPRRDIIHPYVLGLLCSDRQGRALS